MKLLAENDARVDVKIVNAYRDNKGKMVYETVETIGVLEATPEQVEKVIRTALAGAK